MLSSQVREKEEASEGGKEGSEGEAVGIFFKRTVLSSLGGGTGSDSG